MSLHDTGHTEAEASQLGLFEVIDTCVEKLRCSRFPATVTCEIAGFTLTMVRRVVPEAIEILSVEVPDGHCDEDLDGVVTALSQAACPEDQDRVPLMLMFKEPCGKIRPALLRQRFTSVLSTHLLKGIHNLTADRRPRSSDT